MQEVMLIESIQGVMLKQAGLAASNLPDLEWLELSKRVLEFQEL